MAIGPGPVVSDLPLSHEQTAEITKEVSKKKFLTRRFPIRGGMREVDGGGFIKEILLTNGYSRIGNRLRIPAYEDVTLDSDGDIVEIDLNKLAPRVLNALYMVLVVPEKIRRTHRATKASRAARERRRKITSRRSPANSPPSRRASNGSDDDEIHKLSGF